MRRPLEDVRPVGPVVSQSEPFTQRFLLSDDRGVFHLGQDGVIVIQYTAGVDDPDQIREAVDHFLERELIEFVDLGVIGDGELDMTVRDRAANIVYFEVTGISDNDVTVDQVEESIRQFLFREDFSVNDVRMIVS